MLNRKCGGFVLAEFAIALPLLILIAYGLATVSAEIVKVGKDQLADYTLEAEAQYVLERITHQARVAREVEINDSRNSIKFVYHTVNDRTVDYTERATDANYDVFVLNDVLEEQHFIPRQIEGEDSYEDLYAKRIDDGILTSPITGKNFFGETKIISLKYDLDDDKRILHISLEMENLVTKRRIKLNTAVFMPNYISD